MSFNNSKTSEQEVVDSNADASVRKALDEVVETEGFYDSTMFARFSMVAIALVTTGALSARLLLLWTPVIKGYISTYQAEVALRLKWNLFVKHFKHVTAAIIFITVLALTLPTFLWFGVGIAAIIGNGIVYLVLQNQYEVRLRNLTLERALITKNFSGSAVVYGLGAIVTAVFGYKAYNQWKAKQEASVKPVTEIYVAAAGLASLLTMNPQSAISAGIQTRVFVDWIKVGWNFLRQRTIYNRFPAVVRTYGAAVLAGAVATWLVVSPYRSTYRIGLSFPWGKKDTVAEAEERHELLDEKHSDAPVAFVGDELDDKHLDEEEEPHAMAAEHRRSLAEWVKLPRAEQKRAYKRAFVSGGVQQGKNARVHFKNGLKGAMKRSTTKTTIRKDLRSLGVYDNSQVTVWNEEIGDYETMDGKTFYDMLVSADMALDTFTVGNDYVPFSWLEDQGFIDDWYDIDEDDDFDEERNDVAAIRTDEDLLRARGFGELVNLREAHCGLATVAMDKVVLGVCYDPDLPDSYVTAPILSDCVIVPRHFISQVLGDKVNLVVKNDGKEETYHFTKDQVVYHGEDGSNSVEGGGDLGRVPKPKGLSVSTKLKLGLGANKKHGSCMLFYSDFRNEKLSCGVSSGSYSILDRTSSYGGCTGKGVVHTKPGFCGGLYVSVEGDTSRILGFHQWKVENPERTYFTVASEEVNDFIKQPRALPGKV